MNLIHFYISNSRSISNVKEKRKRNHNYYIFDPNLHFGFLGDKAFYCYTVLYEKDVNYEFSLGQEDKMYLTYTVNFPYKANMIALNGLTKNLLGQSEMNGITKLRNGHLTQLMNELDPEIIQEYYSSIIQYSEYCKAHDVKLLYVQPAYIISKYDNQLPTGDKDYSNKIIDELINEIEDCGVSTIDLRQEMYDDGMNQYGYYFRTDHHWTTEGAFYAYQKIVRWIAMRLILLMTKN